MGAFGNAKNEGGSLPTCQSQLPHERTRVGKLSYFCGDETALRKALALCGKTHTALAVFTPGATVAARAERDETLLALLERADVLLADGYGCRLAARLCRACPPPRVAGIDLAKALLREADAFCARVFLYGAKAGVAARAAAHLQAQHPHITFAVSDGYGEDPIDSVCAFAPHFVFVCLGVPRQELWIAQNAHRTGAVCIGLGGSFDVWAGNCRRAPKAVQRMGMEWAYRTLKEPRRISRLFPLPRYFLSCFRNRKEG